MLAKQKQYVETLTMRMQFFHLDPKWHNFLEICEYKKIQIDQSHVMEIWKLGCLITFCDEWSEQYDHPWLNQDHWNNFKTLEQSIMRRAINRPNTTVLDQVWYLYFATGDYKYLKAAFEIAGNENAKADLRETAIEMYANIRERYLEKTADLPEHSYNWEKLNAVINDKKELVSSDEELTDLIEQIQDSKYEFVEDPYEQKINRGMKLFSELLKNDIR